MMEAEKEKITEDDNINQNDQSHQILDENHIISDQFFFVHCCVCLNLPKTENQGISP